MKNFKSGRIALDGDAAVALSEMCEELRQGGQFVKITPSGLVSWIVKYFREKDFERTKIKIREEHLNRKEWLKNAIKNAGDDDVEQVLRDALDGMARTRKRRANPTDNSVSSK